MELFLGINGVEIAAYPAPGGFQVTILDLDDSESTVRTADATLTRDRIAVKRQVDLTFNALTNQQISGVLKAMRETFFEFTFPDPMEGDYITRTMYVGNRPAAIPIVKNGVIWWEGLAITVTEQ